MRNKSLRGMMIGLVMWFMSSMAFSTPVFEIKGEIGGATRAIIAKMMIAVSAKPAQIDLVIDSPGGYVTVGMEMVDLIREAQAAGTKVVCTVRGQGAASMAFVIFTACSSRFIEKESLLLAHDIATVLPGLFGVWINRQGAVQLAKDLQEGQDAIEKVIHESFNPPAKVYRYLSDNEVFFNGADANVYVPGFINGFVASPVKKPNPPVMLQFDFGILKDKYGKDAYIYNK